MISILPTMVSLCYHNLKFSQQDRFKRSKRDSNDARERL